MFYTTGRPHQRNGDQGCPNGNPNFDFPVWLYGLGRGSGASGKSDVNWPGPAASGFLALAGESRINFDAKLDTVDDEPEGVHRKAASTKKAD